MNPNNRPKARELQTSLFKQAMSYGCEITGCVIKHAGEKHTQVRIIDEYPNLDNGIFLLTAGIHGTEIVGPLMIQQRFAGIIASTRAAGLRLVCYPLMNPSGYDNGTDRNIDKDGGSHNSGNNDFLRYQMFDGSWTWKPPGGHSYKRWCWSSNPDVGERQPAETAVMHQMLKGEDWPNIKVALDIHQDNLTPNLPPGAYQYVFGDLLRYHSIIDKIRTLVPVLADMEFDFDRNNPNNTVRSDKNGCIQFHDGTLSDLAHRIGVPHALTIETTGATELQMAMEVNMTWIRSLCHLASQEK